jgi:FdhD protein
MKTQKPYLEFAIKTYLNSKDTIINENIQVIKEHMLELFINDEKWMTFICSPTNLEELALGFLWNENVISDLNQIKSVKLSPDLTKIEIKLNRLVTKPTHFHRTTTGMALPQNEVAAREVAGFSYPAKELPSLYNRFSEAQKLHDLVGGFHSAALSDGQNIKIVMEDLGRHNCLDKLAGAWLKMEPKVSPVVLTISGRISSEMVLKSVAMGTQILISRTSPTALAIEIAEKAGICLVGYMRSKQFHIYSHPEYLV